MSRRYSVLTPEKISNIIKLKKKGVEVVAISKEVDVPYGTVIRTLYPSARKPSFKKFFKKLDLIENVASFVNSENLPNKNKIHKTIDLILKEGRPIVAACKEANIGPDTFYVYNRFKLNSDKNLYGYEYERFNPFIEFIKTYQKMRGLEHITLGVVKGLELNCFNFGENKYHNILSYLF